MNIKDVASIVIDGGYMRGRNDFYGMTVQEVVKSIGDNEAFAAVLMYSKCEIIVNSKKRIGVIIAISYQYNQCVVLIDDNKYTRNFNSIKFLQFPHVFHPEFEVGMEIEDIYWNGRGEITGYEVSYSAITNGIYVECFKEENIRPIRKPIACVFNVDNVQGAYYLYEEDRDIDENKVELMDIIYLGEKTGYVVEKSTIKTLEELKKRSLSFSEIKKYSKIRHNIDEEEVPSDPVEYAVEALKYTEYLTLEKVLDLINSSFETDYAYERQCPIADYVETRVDLSELEFNNHEDIEEEDDEDYYDCDYDFYDYGDYYDEEDDEDEELEEDRGVDTLNFNLTEIDKLTEAAKQIKTFLESMNYNFGEVEKITEVEVKQAEEPVSANAQEVIDRLIGFGYGMDLCYILKDTKCFFIETMEGVTFRTEGVVDSVFKIPGGWAAEIIEEDSNKKVIIRAVDFSVYSSKKMRLKK